MQFPLSVNYILQILGTTLNMAAASDTLPVSHNTKLWIVFAASVVQMVSGVTAHFYTVNGQTVAQTVKGGK